MRIFYRGKDGGPESPVTGYWLIEIKSLFSIVLLRFNKGTREAFHSHAFNALTWYLFGDMTEQRIYKNGYIVQKDYKFSLIPKITKRDNLHRVFARKTSWAISVRGPWSNTWQEYKDDKFITLTHGRKIIE